MDHEEYDHEAIALLIEDLKNEDPAIKLDAVGKLHHAAAVIGNDISRFI